MRILFSCISLLVLSACVSTPPAESVRRPIAPPHTPQMAAPAPDPTPPPAPAAPVQFTGRKIPVGLLLPLNGEHADLGRAMQDAASLALFDKYATLKSTPNAPQIVLLPKDTGNDPKQAQKAAIEAIQEGAQFLLGPVFAESTTAITPIAQKMHIPMLSFSNNREIADAGVFMYGFNPEAQAQSVLHHAHRQDITRIAALLPANEYGQRLAESIRRDAMLNGAEITGIEFYAQGAKMVDPEIQRLTGGRNVKTLPMQALFLAESGENLTRVMDRLTNFGVTKERVKFLGTGAWDDPEILKNQALHGAWFASAPPRLSRGFEMRFTSQYRYTPMRIASLAYDAVALVATLAQEGSLNTQGISRPQGFSAPANGTFRCHPSGICERTLSVLEVQPTGFKEVAFAARSF